MAETPDDALSREAARRGDLRQRRRLERLEDAFNLVFETIQRTLLVGVVQFVARAIDSSLLFVVGELLMYVLWGWLLYAMHRRYAPRLLPDVAPWKQYLRQAALIAAFYAAYGVIVLTTGFGLSEITRAAEAGYFL